MFPSRLARFLLICGAGITLFGCTQWVVGLTYRVAAGHEASTVGQVVNISEGPRHTIYEYEFRVNGVKMRDSSELCRTPLSPVSCIAGGPAVVYYSDQPFSNSLLEDFAVASRDAIKRGNQALLIGLPLIVVLGTLLRLNMRWGEPEPPEDADEKPQEDESDMPSVVPRD